MYVVALFDANTEEIIKQIWKLLKRAKITDYGVNKVGRRPHLTLASYENIDLIGLQKKMKEFHSLVQKPIIIEFTSISTFVESGTLYFEPALDKGLKEFHSKYHNYFYEFTEQTENLYLPDNWIPHCTLANRLLSREIEMAKAFCTSLFFIIKGEIKQIALMDNSERPLRFTTLLYL